jgi:hypothetical protein
MRLKTPTLGQALSGIALGAILLVLERIFSGGHEAEGAPWPGFYALFGLVGAVALVVVAKVLGHLLILRKERPYD